MNTESESVLSPSELESMLNDDGLAAKEHLSAGRPIFYMDPAYPGQLLRMCPDGSCQIVTMCEDGQFEVVREL